MKRLFALILLILPLIVIARPAKEVTSRSVSQVLGEIFQEHATYKTFNEELARRALTLFIEQIDPSKTYLLEPEIKAYLSPDEALLTKVVKEQSDETFATFRKVHEIAKAAINRRSKLEEQVKNAPLLKGIDAKTLHKAPFAKTEKELLERLIKVRSLQFEAAEEFEEDILKNFDERLIRWRKHWEDQILGSSQQDSDAFLYTYVTKAIASALDSQTLFFTPREARAFIASMQQKLFGIGVQLRDNLNGLVVTEIIKGGPSERSKQLRVGDRIIAVDKAPIVGMHIIDSVELIRGKKGRPVDLTVVRVADESLDGKLNREAEIANHKNNKEISKIDKSLHETLNITIVRDEIVFEEQRMQVTSIPFGKGHIAHLKLYSFYADDKGSSAEDLKAAIEKMAKKKPLEGVILDLRGNMGGLLVPAVHVCGLFMDRGIVVSLKDNKGDVQHLRHLGMRAYSGPLVVLVDPLSASCSEIVAGTLQEYGCAIVVGGKTFGKGTFQRTKLDMNAGSERCVRNLNEYKVTCGTYHTISGRTPQLEGVASDIEVLGPLSALEIGENLAKYPLKNESIASSFEDTMSDLSLMERPRLRNLYRAGVQKKIKDYTQYLTLLRENSKKRLKKQKNYQVFLKRLEKEKEKEPAKREPLNENDFQLDEAVHVIKDLIYLIHAA